MLLRHSYTRMLLLVVLCMPAACRVAKIPANSSLSNAKPEQLNLAYGAGRVGAIAFLTMNIAVIDSVNDRYAFSLSDKIFADGTVKKQWYGDENNFETGYLYCEILDGEQKRIDLLKVINPLERIVEYTNEKTNALEKRTLKSTAGSFTLRFNFNNQSKYLAIYKMGSTASTLKNIYYAQF